MASCKECIHFVVCEEVPTKSADDCDFFKDCARFVELLFETKGEVYFIGQLSKMIFLNSKQAEQALKERENSV